jgi:hypothetical protein
MIDELNKHILDEKIAEINKRYEDAKWQYDKAVADLKKVMRESAEEIERLRIEWKKSQGIL